MSGFAKIFFRVTHAFFNADNSIFSWNSVRLRKVEKIKRKERKKSPQCFSKGFRILFISDVGYSKKVNMFPLGLKYKIICWNLEKKNLASTLWLLKLLYFLLVEVIYFLKIIPQYTYIYIYLFTLIYLLLFLFFNLFILIKFLLYLLFPTLFCTISFVLLANACFVYYCPLYYIICP